MGTAHGSIHCVEAWLETAHVAVDLDEMTLRLTPTDDVGSWVIPLVKGGTYHGDEYWTAKHTNQPVVKVASIVNGNFVLWLPSLYDLMTKLGCERCAK